MLKKILILISFISCVAGCDEQETKTVVGIPLSVSHCNSDYINGLSILIRDTNGRLKVCEGFTRYSTLGCFNIIDFQIKEGQAKNIEIIGEENSYDYIIMNKIKVHFNDNEEYDFNLDFVR